MECNFCDRQDVNMRQKYAASHWLLLFSCDRRGQLATRSEAKHSLQISPGIQAPGHASILGGGVRCMDSSIDKDIHHGCARGPAKKINLCECVQEKLIHQVAAERHRRCGAVVQESHNRHVNESAVQWQASQRHGADESHHGKKGLGGLHCLEV